jgi:hypothetical protein
MQNKTVQLVTGKAEKIGNNGRNSEKGTSCLFNMVLEGRGGKSRRERIRMEKKSFEPFFLQGQTTVPVYILTLLNSGFQFLP